MSELAIVPSQIHDLANILLLYQTVGGTESGLARTRREFTEEYVRHNLLSSQTRGLSLIARISPSEQIVGEIHAYRPVPQVFSHVLSDLTIAVHPHYQGCGVGRALFTHLLTEVKNHYPEILRIELIARESNQRAIQFYQSIGFLIEGRLVGRIRQANGCFEADIPMAWHRSKT